MFNHAIGAISDCSIIHDSHIIHHIDDPFAHRATLYAGRGLEKFIEAIKPKGDIDPKDQSSLPSPRPGISPPIRDKLLSDILSFVDPAKMR